MAIYEYPVLKVAAELYLGANYFNHSNGAYEPLIEPWEVFATVKQKDIGSSQMIKVKSGKMLNLNLTYGVAICLKNVMDAINLDSKDWVDEVELEEVKRKLTMKKSFSHSRSIKYTDMSATEEEKATFNTPRKPERRSASRDSLRRTRTDQDGSISSDVDEDAKGAANFETDTFEFQNNIGVPIVVELEDFSANIVRFEDSLEEDQKELFTSKCKFELGVSQGEFGSLSDSMYTQSLSGEKGRGKRNYLKSTAKFFKKQMNKLSNFKIIDDLPLKVDILIDGMRPIKGVPIEVAGRRSYELYFEDDDDKTARSRNVQLSIISDVFQEGINKIVSLESQFIMTNHSDIDLNIGYALLTDETMYCEELTEEEIIKSKKDYQDLNLIEEFDGGESFKKLIKFDALEQFYSIQVGEEYRVPLSWFMMDVAIFYKSVIETEETYNRIIPDLKRTFLKKKVTKSSIDAAVPRYNFSKKEGTEVEMISFEVEINKCNPTTLNRPPQYN